MNKSKLPLILAGLGLVAVGAVLFWPKSASAAPPQPNPQPKPIPPPQPSPQPSPSPSPAPAPVPIPPKMDTGPGAQVEYPLLVIATGVNVRSGPSTNYPVIATVTKGDRLRLPHSNSWSAPTPGADQGWSGVILGDGRTGWIASHLITIPA